MSARQYSPIYMTVADKPLIIYPAKDEVPLTDIIDRSNLVKQVEDLYNKKDERLARGKYHILFVWNKSGSLMLDIWIHTNNQHSDSGLLLEFYAYENGNLVQTDDIASGDTLIVLGREEENRRTFPTTAEYLQARKLPVFPEGMTPTEEFA